MPERITGYVKTVVYERGFGFIVAGRDEIDYYFHVSNLLDGTNFKDLKPGDVIRFIPAKHPKGYQAIAVELHNSELDS